MTINSTMKGFVQFAIKLSLAGFLSVIMILELPAKNIPNSIIPRNSAGLSIDLTKYFTLSLPISATNTNVGSNDTVFVNTTMGGFFIKLFTTNTPHTVTNFLDYVTNGYYNNMLIERLAPNFVIQTGSYQADSDFKFPFLATNFGTIPSEAGISNTAGTVAMALSTGSNSATSAWYINLTNNSSLLDGTNDGGPFTVFGKVLGDGMSTVVRSIASLPNYNLGINFSQLPLNGVTNGQSNLYFSNLEVINTMQLVPLPYLSAPSCSDTNSFLVTLIGTKLLVTPRAPNSAPVTISVSAADTNGNAETKSFQVSQRLLTQNISFQTIFANYSTSPFSIQQLFAAISTSSGLGASPILKSGPAYISQGQLYFSGTGTVTLVATQPGKPPFYLPAPPATGFIVVDRGFQTIQTNSFPPIENRTNAVLPLTLTLTNYPTSSAGLPVSLAVGSGSATLQGKTVTISGAGTISLMASQPGNKKYYPALTLTNSFIVSTNSVTN